MNVVGVKLCGVHDDAETILKETTENLDGWHEACEDEDFDTFDTHRAKMSLSAVKSSPSYPTKEYQFFNNNPDVKIGSMVLCACANGLVSGIVVKEYNITEKTKATAHVICSIDMTNYNEGKTKLRKMKEIKKQINDRYKAYQEMKLFEMMAKEDEQIASLLNDYKDILG